MTISEIEESFAFLNEYSYHDDDESQHSNLDDIHEYDKEHSLLKEFKRHSKLFHQEYSKDVQHNKLRNRS